MSSSLSGLSKEDLVDALLQLIRSDASDAAAAIEDYEDPTVMGSALSVVVRKFYRESRDLDHMIAAGQLGIDYCLRKAALESDAQKAWNLKKLAQVMAFNTAVNCWPGWAEPGVVIEERHLRAATEIAARGRQLVQELGLKPRAQSNAHWLVGAIDLAAGRLSAGRSAFEEAEQAVRDDETSVPQALLARGYIGLTLKADPKSREQGSVMFDEVLRQLRLDGSEDAVFFADQLVTAERVFRRAMDYLLM